MGTDISHECLETVCSGKHLDLTTIKQLRKVHGEQLVIYTINLVIVRIVKSRREQWIHRVARMG
jgi:type VI protein secretion system component Hcp